MSNRYLGWLCHSKLIQIHQSHVHKPKQKRAIKKSSGKCQHYKNSQISISAKVITVFEIHNRPLHRLYTWLARYQVLSRTITQDDLWSHWLLHVLSWIAPFRNKTVKSTDYLWWGNLWVLLLVVMVVTRSVVVTVDVNGVVVVFRDKIEWNATQYERDLGYFS
jgi:hypothetical protein